MSKIFYILYLALLIIVSCSAKTTMMSDALIEKKRWEEVERYLDNGGDPNWISEETGWPLITYLIVHKKTELALKVIEKGAKLAAQNSGQESPIFLASISGMDEVVRAMLSHSNVISKDDLTRSLLSSTEEGHLQVIKLIMSYGVDVNSTSGRFSALYLALYQGHEDIAQYLLSKGADYHFKTDDNTTLLVPAAIGGNLKLMKLLVEKGLSVNQANDTGDTPLLAAMIGKNKIKIAEYLLSQGANPCVKNNEGYSAYSLSMASETALELKKIFRGYQCK